MPEIIQQTVELPGTAQQVFKILTSKAAFSKMCGGAPTELTAKEGSLFSCFGGMIHGRNLEVAKDKMVVQAWRAKPWPAGFYSMVKIELKANGAKTKLNLEHWGFPAGQKKHLEQGWHDNYWTPLQKHLS